MTKTADHRPAINIAHAMRIPTLSLWLAIAMLIAAIGAAVYVAFFWRPGPALIGPPDALRDDCRSLDGGATAIILPAFGDEMVRTMVCRVWPVRRSTTGFRPRTGCAFRVARAG